MCALTICLYSLRAQAADVPFTRDLTLDTPVVRAAAEAAWVTLPPSAYRNWFRCEGTRTFLPGELHEATDPLAPVCAEARDLARPSLPALVRVERTGVATTRLTLSNTLPTSVRRRYLRMVDRALREWSKPGSLGEDVWVQSQPTPARTEAAFTSVAALAPDQADCLRRYDWLAAVDGPRATRVATERVAASVDHCSAAFAGALLESHAPAADVATRVVTAMAKAPDLPAALLRLADYPEPVRTALAPDIGGWQATIAAQHEAALAARAATIAALSPAAHACYDLVQQAAGPDGVTLAAAVNGPDLARGHTAVWAVPHALLHPTSVATRAQIEDGHGGTAWMLDLTSLVPAAALPRAAGTVDTVTVVGPDGVARPVPLLHVVCWPDVLLPPL